MSTLSLRLPDSLHKQLKELAAQEGISINQFIVTAVAEKMSALMTEGCTFKHAPNELTGTGMKAPWVKSLMSSLKNMTNYEGD